MYVFGGLRGSGALNDIYEYDIGSDSWTLKATTGGPPSARFNHSAIESNGKMYIFGGSTFGGTVNKEVWVLDLSTFVWTQKTSGASERMEHSAVEYNGKMYVFGGYKNPTTYNDMWEYDISGDSWASKTSGATNRRAHTAIMDNDKMYVWGGREDSSYFNTIYQYDITTDAWMQLTSGGVARYTHTAIVFSNKMYIWGGHDGTSYLKTIYAYDIDTDAWTSLTPGGTASALASAIIYQSKIYIYGGETSFGVWTGSIYDYDVGYSAPGYLYTDEMDLGSAPTNNGEWQLSDIKPTGTDLTYEAWWSTSGNFDLWDEITQGDAKPPVRSSPAYCIVGTDLYIYGGSTGTGYLDDFWKCDLSDPNFPWTNLSNTSGPGDRAWSTIVEYNGKIYHFGGWDGAARNNDLYEYDISTDTWSVKSPTGSPPSIRSSQVAVIYNAKMYVHGGLGGAHLKDIHEYDIAGDSWTAKTSGATERYGHVGVVSGTKMYAYAGWNTGSGAINSIEEYDFSGDSWSTKTAGGTAASERVGTVYDGSIYVHGGNTPSEINIVDIYNISGDSWSTGRSGATGRSGHAGGLYGKKLFIWGGYDGSDRLNDLWWYGTLGGDATSIGTIVDGDEITDLKQYWMVKASLTANTNRDSTPTLKTIRADFSTFKTFTNNLDLIPTEDFETGLLTISSQTTKIDTFEPSTVGSQSITFDFNASISSYLKNKFPKNKIVKIYVGFVAPGFTFADHVEYFRGQITDYNITSDDKVRISVQNYQINWKTKVPETWESAGDDVIWTAMHPIDVMLDIFKNYTESRDSEFVLSSFDTVKAATPGYKVTRTITKQPEDAKKLIEELRILLSCSLIPQVNGAIKLKQWDSAEASVFSLTDSSTVRLAYKGNMKSLINKTITYYDWTGSGSKADDFGELRLDVVAASETNWGETAIKETKDKWTGAAEEAQIVTFSTNITDRYGDPPPIIDVITDKKLMAIETGDIVDVTTLLAPSSDGSGISAVKFQVIQKTLDYMKNDVSLTLLEA